MPLEKGALCPARIPPGSWGCWDGAGNFSHAMEQVELVLLITVL